MNSEAQRARNKRKRDKLREKRRMERCSLGIYRFRLDGHAFIPKYQCGLMPLEYGVELCCAHMGKDHLPGEVWESNPVEWSTEWVYCSTHDLSSSALDAIQCFNNTWRELLFTTQSIVLTIQINGQERRKVWQGHTYAAEDAAMAVSWFVRLLSSEESLQTPSTASQ